MIPTSVALSFALISFTMAAIPGPNSAYLISRSVCQGKQAGFASLIGILVGFVIYMFLTAYGITAVLQAQPIAFDALRISGALYLCWMAWKVVKPGGVSPLEIRDLGQDPPLKLVGMGIVTNLLNPKAATLYLTLLPQFVDPARGSVFAQSVQLGCIHLVFSMSVNSMTILAASKVASYVREKPQWIRVQKYVLGSVFAGLALRLALEKRR